MDLIGKRLTYTYPNGWQLRTEFRQDQVRFEMLTGQLVGRPSVDALYAQVADDIYQVCWYGPFGVVVCLVVNLEGGTVNGFMAMPRWAADVHASNDERGIETRFEDLLLLGREQPGPDGPREVMFEQAQISVVEEISPEPIEPTSPTPLLS